MSVLSPRRALIVGACAAAMLVSGSTAWSAVPAGRTGPISSDAAYLVPQVPGVNFTSVLTAGDAKQRSRELIARAVGEPLAP